MKLFRSKTAEKTGVQSGTPWAMFGWASSIAGDVPGIGALFKALRGSGASEGQSPYDRDIGVSGAVGVSTFDSTLGANNMLMPWTLPRYRVMSSHSTLALAEMSLVLTILAAETGVLVDDDLADDDIAQKGKLILENDVLAKRQSIMRGCLRALRYGWKDFENVFAKKNDTAIGEYIGLAKFKELAGDTISLHVDTKGNLVKVVANGTPLEAPYFTHIVHDKEDDNWFGRSRHENARRAWANALRLEDLAMTLTNKVTGRAPYVGVPADDPDHPLVKEAVAAGQPTPNQKMGSMIARALFAGEPVVYLNSANIDSQDLRLNPDLANGELVKVNFLDIGNPGPAITSLIDWAAALDKMLVRAWLRPERATLESQGGASRADSESHGDMTIADAECTHEDIVEQLNEQLIKPLIRENCGEQYVGRIRLVAMPLQDETKQIWSAFFDKLAGDPAFLAAVIKMIGGNGVVEAMKKCGIDLKTDPEQWDYESAADTQAKMQQAEQAAAQQDAADDKPAKGDELSADKLDDLDLLLMSGWDGTKHPRDEGGRFVVIETPLFNGDAKAAKAWALEHVRGTYTNAQTGKLIGVARGGIEKVTNKKAYDKSGTPDHFEAVQVLPQLIQNAELIETHPDRDGNANIKAIHRFQARLKVGDRLHDVKLTVKEHVQPEQGHKFYTHELTEIELPNGLKP